MNNDYIEVIDKYDSWELSVKEFIDDNTCTISEFFDNYFKPLNEYYLKFVNNTDDYNFELYNELYNKLLDYKSYADYMIEVYNARFNEYGIRYQEVDLQENCDIMFSTYLEILRTFAFRKLLKEEEFRE